MYIRLIRNKPQGNAITGRLVIDGRWYCNTLERKGYQILALFYPVKVTHSPRFKRILPLVCNVPKRTGIRFHRGTKPEHSMGCILVVADNPSRARELIGAEVVENNVVEVIYSKFFITFAVDLHLKYGIRPSLSLVETCQQRSVPILYTSKNWIVRWAMTPYL